MVKKYYRLFAIASLVASFSLFSSGCSQKTVSSTGMESTTASDVAQQEKQVGEQSVAMGSEESLDSSSLPQQESSFTILEGRTTGPMLPVYYDFDQSTVRNEQKDRIKENARYLKGFRVANVIIEGNCDERGTNEYNMALGERRAISAKKYMTNLGVAASRISTISYGEEKPLNHGHDELAWSQNRRSDFVQIR